MTKKPEPSFPVIRCEEWQCHYVFPNGACCRHPIGHTAQHFPVEARISIGSGLTYLECPCCGGDGAASDGEGSFFDGQSLICGCAGWVSVDEDGDAWINTGDEPCPSTAPCHGDGQ